MGTVPSARSAADNELRYQKMKVDFYRVEGGDFGRVEFQNALVGAMRARGRNRSRVVFGERVDLYSCDQSGQIIEGEIGRVRMNDTPAIANPDCTVAEDSTR